MASIKVKHKAIQDDDGYWWIINRNGEKVRKISYHKIMEDDTGKWCIKKRNGEMSKKSFASLQEAFDYSDTLDRLIVFGIIIGIVILLSIVFSK